MAGCKCNDKLLARLEKQKEKDEERIDTLSEEHGGRRNWDDWEDYCDASERLAETEGQIKMYKKLCKKKGRK